uniref:RBR-type E3 ubiquitin transferase n=1 Tax=Parascaris univalens TaxID=6257 RepID=A0A915CFB2_PARUN
RGAVLSQPGRARKFLRSRETRDEEYREEGKVGSATSAGDRLGRWSKERSLYDLEGAVHECRPKIDKCVWQFDAIRQQILEHARQLANSKTDASKGSDRVVRLALRKDRSTMATEPTCRSGDLVQKAAATRIELPVSPALVPMIYEAQKFGIVNEVAVLCACVELDPIFSTWTDESEKWSASLSLMPLTFHRGDPVTYILICDQYMSHSEAFRKRWCVENSIDEAKIKSAFKTADIIVKAVRGFKADWSCMSCKFDLPSVIDYVPWIFRDVFKENIAVYSGLQKKGYLDLKTQKYIKVCSTSVLSLFGELPEYIVYARLVENQAVTVMAADASWVAKTADPDVLDAARKRRFIAFNVSMGPTAKAMLIEHMERLRLKVDRECHMNEDLRNDPYGRLQIFVTAEKLHALQKYIEEHIKPRVELLKRESLEAPVSDANYMVRIGAGGMINHLVLPGDSCSAESPESCQLGGTGGHLPNKVLVGYSGLVPLDVIRRVQKHFRIDVRWYRRKSYREAYLLLRHVTQEQVELASTILASRRRDLQFSIQMFDPSKGERQFSRNIFRQIVFYDLDEHMTSDDLRSATIPLLEKVNIHVRNEDVFVLYSRSYPCEDERRRKKYERRIASYLENIGRSAKIIENRHSDAKVFSEEPKYERQLPFNVHVNSVSAESDLEMSASVHFLNFNIGVRFFDAIMEHLRTHAPLSMGEIYVNSARMTGVYTIDIGTSRRLAFSLRGDLKRLESRLANTHEVKLELGYDKYGSFDSCATVSVVGKYYDRVLDAKANVEALLDGITLDCRRIADRIGDGVGFPDLPYHQLFSSSGRSWLVNLEASMGRENLILTVFPMKVQLKIQGSAVIIREAMRRIEFYLRGWMDSFLGRTILLRPPMYKSGIFDALLNKNGQELHSILNKVEGGFSIDVNPSLRELYFYGRRAQRDQLIEFLDDLSNSLVPSKGDSDGGCPPECVICLNRASPEAYCLEACGHYACLVCLNQQLVSAFANCNLPIECVSCGQPFVWKDFEALLMDSYANYAKDIKRIEPLISTALTVFMNSNLDKYRHCITPDCRGVYEITDEPHLRECALCGREVCTRCGNEDHNEMSCEKYGELRNNVDVSVRHWISENPENRRICPNALCQAVIEKQAGCSHMRCERCLTHFCWLCLYTAEEAGAIYRHIEEAHSESDLLEVAFEELNDPFIHEFALEHLRELELDQDNFDGDWPN